MDQQTAQSLTGVFGMVAGCFWLAKYYFQFCYEKTFDPFLNQYSYTRFLFSLGSVMGYKIRFSLPWYQRDRKAEEADPSLQLLVSKMRISLAFFYLFFIIAMMFAATGDSQAAME